MKSYDFAVHAQSDEAEVHNYESYVSQKIFHKIVSEIISKLT